MSTSEDEVVETLIKNQFILTQEQLKEFPLMNRLMEHELLGIKSFALFENSNGVGMIYVTKDDQVFGIGSNGEYNLLGVCGHFYKCERVERPVRIDRLCGKRIVNISMGGTIGAAIDATGTVYTWGKEQLVVNGIDYPTRSWSGANKLISCLHSALAIIEEDGNVFLTGDIMIWKKRETVVHLSCGNFHMAMLGSSGNVYTWGRDRNLQPGCPPYVSGHERTVKKVILEQPCSSVSCGLFSTFFQTKSGELWACGANSGIWGYLNVKSKQNHIEVPEKVDIRQKVVKLITFSKNEEYSTYLAVTEDEDLLVWDGQNQGTPRLMHWKNFAEICKSAVPRNVMFRVDDDSINEPVVKPISKLILEKLEIVQRLCDEVRTEANDLNVVVNGT